MREHERPEEPFRREESRTKNPDSGRNGGAGHSRRRFLRVLGGVAGLDVLAGSRDTPQKHSSHGFSRDTTGYGAQPGSKVEIDGDLDLQGNDIVNSNLIRADHISTRTVTDVTEFQPSPTDGIREAIEALPREGGRIWIPTGGGSGEDGAYVVSETETLTSYYGTPSVGVKVDRSDIWFLSDGAEVTVEPGAGIYLFLVSSLAHGKGPVASSQVENVNFYGIDFNGRGRDGTSLVFYEATDCTVRKCHIRNWSPKSSSFPLGEWGLKAQHHADNISVFDNLFTCNTDISAYCFFDGSHGSVIANNHFKREGDFAPRLFQQNVNGDFDREPRGVTISENVFDYRAASSGDVILELGLGTRFVGNRFLSPRSSGTGASLFLSSRLETSYDGVAPTIAENLFMNHTLGFLNRGDIGGFSIRDNTWVLTTGENTNAIHVTGTQDEQGAVRNGAITGNTVWNNADLGSSGVGVFLAFEHGNFAENIITDNTVYDIEWFVDDNSDGGLELDESTWDNPEVVVTEEDSVPVAENGGETTLAHGETIAHGLIGQPTRYFVDSRDSESIATVTALDDSTLTVAIMDFVEGAQIEEEVVVTWWARV